MLKNTPRETQDKQKRTIDMVTRLYVHTLQTDKNISAQEISILYSLLTNLFAHVDVSWETYVQQIIDSDYLIEDTLTYLNKHLSQVDKVRILLSLIVMAKTAGELHISEITQILEICKSLSLNPEGFIGLLDFFESDSHGIASVSCEHHITHIRHSLFSDYVVFGSAANADIRFRNADLAAYECALFAISDYTFIAIGSNSTLLLDGKPVKTNSIYLLSPQSIISLANTEFNADCLKKIYQLRDENDEIIFRKSNYDFIVRKRGSWYSMMIHSGSITMNGKAMQRSRHYERHYEIYYDDILQIKGYAPWNLTVLIENRSSIGLDDLIPKALYINRERDYYNLSRIEQENSLAYIEVKDGSYLLHPPKKGWSLFLNQKKVLETSPLLLNADTITIDKRNFRINSFFDLIEIPFEIDLIRLMDIKHYFPDGQLALDSISCEARKGQLIGILGQSGSGKSTLVKILSGENMPTYGQVMVDGKNYFANLSFYNQYFGYVPQDDLLYPNLTVYENLWYRLRLRMPYISAANLDQKITNILHQVNLSHQSDTKVGEQKTKNLSGGERKRLNIALELLFEPTVIICDEPTSGLSFTDAEQIIDILDSLTQQGKIVLVTIHQPNSSIFRKFDNVMLMDMGGRMVYYGAPDDCYSYFDEELAQLSYRAEEISRKQQLMTSDFMYDVITYPEYNENNDPVYEQIHGFVQPKRKFSPEYWRDKFKRKVLFEMIQHEAVSPAPNPGQFRKKRTKQNLKSRVIQFLGYLGRSFKMKLRNRTNNIITFVQAPLLGFIVSFILRYTPDGGAYYYAKNNNIGIYIFVSIIAFLFLGLANSVEEILDERKIILRESQMNLKISYYLVSKLVTLSLFTVIQALLYQSIGGWILGIRGLWQVSIVYLFAAGCVGISLGLLCSSFIKEKKSIINLLPLLLIPQIIFGGAVIEFERMNRSLTLYHKHPVPEIVQTIPSRWLFEGMTTAYAKNTVFHRTMDKMEARRQKTSKLFIQGKLSREDYEQAKSIAYYAKLNLADKLNPDLILNENLNAAVGLMDGIALSEEKDQFLSSYKMVKDKKLRTWNFNLLIIALYLVLFNMITSIKLKYYFKD